MSTTNTNVPDVFEQLLATGHFTTHEARERLERVRVFVQEKGGCSVDCHALAQQLIAFHCDLNSLLAALLFCAGVDMERDATHVRDSFGADVLSIVRGLITLDRLRPDVSKTDTETLRQMLLVMARDLRVMLIFLIYRLHLLEHMHVVSESQRKRIASEAMHLYAPIASRLGMYSLKWQLEDHAFIYLHPEMAHEITVQLERFGAERRALLDAIQQELTGHLGVHGFSARVSGRIKSMYSIYRKMKRKNISSIFDLYDIFAVRVIVPTVYEGGNTGREMTGHLYTVLGLIHQKWTPLPDRFKDYVAVAKPNGYQSLHTTVLVSSQARLDQPLEIQIRTERMHREAEHGVAAHWLYEDTDSASTQYSREELLSQVQQDTEDGVGSGRLQKQISWLRGLMRMQETTDAQSGEHAGEHAGEQGDADVNADVDARGDHHRSDFQLDLFADRIFVFTPRGDVKDLPIDATPIDFAYAVHTDIGHRCSMARVNGVIVPLSHPLKNGDVVDIVLKPKPLPKSEWVSFVKTASARQKIKIWFNSQNRDLSFRQGRDALNKHLRRLSEPLLDDRLTLLKMYDGAPQSLSQRRRIVETIGNGTVSAYTIIRKLFAPEQLMEPVAPPPLKIVQGSARPEDKILLGGEAGLPVRLAQCCAPQEHQPIVGYVTRQYASIHRADCAHLHSCNPARILDARWRAKDATAYAARYVVRVLVEAVNRIGLIRDLTTVTADLNINILDFALRSQTENTIMRSLLLEVSGYEQLDELMQRMERVTGVLQVIREVSRPSKGHVA